MSLLVVFIMTLAVSIFAKTKFLPKPILETIYYKTITPSVLYGVIVGGSCSSDPDQIHLRATRIIYNLPQNIHGDDIMNAPHWNSICVFYIERLLVIAYNI